MKRKIDNKTLDLVAKRLLTPPAAAGRDEIDKIVANPDLFSGVMKKVIDGGMPPRRIAILTPWKVVPAVGTFAVVALALVWGVRYQQPTSFTAGNAKPEKNAFSKNPDFADPGVVRTGIPPQPITGKTSAVRTTKDSYKVERAAIHNAEPRTVAPHRERPMPSDEFQSVSYTGDPLETAGGGHVVRVEMKRSALFALGVDLPLENADDTVKADLLVGRDGVTRAVRVVD